MRRLALTVVGCIVLAGGSASAASGHLVVRRLTGEAPAATSRPDERRAAPAPARAVVPPPLAPAGPGAGPAAWRYEMNVRAQRSRAFPHVLSRPGYDWSAPARRRRGAPPLELRRSPHVRSAAQASPAGSPPQVMRIAFLRIDFAHDRGGPLSTGDGRFDLSGPDTTLAPIDRPPHNRDFYLAHLEALRRYYDAQSYGRILVEGDVWPRTQQDSAYTLNDMADFGPWAFSQDIYPAALHFMRSSFFAADSQATVRYSDPIPWDDFDAFMIIHAGSDLQSDLRQDSPEDIPSFTIGVLPEEAVIFPDSTNIPIDRVCIVPETASQDGFYGAINGLVAHENGHNLFGFADLYDVFTGLPQVGYWSLMDSGNLAGAPFLLPDGAESFAVGLLPPSLDPFHRFFISDVLPFVDVVDDTMAIADSQRNPDMRRLFLSSDEYLVIENRFITGTDQVPLDQDSTTRVVLGPKAPDRYEYDALLPALPYPEGTPPPHSGGLLIWHIDASRIPFATATRIDPTREYGFNSTGGPRAVRVIEADALEDLGDPTSPFIFGSPYDPWFRSNNRRLSDDTQPSLVPHAGSRPHTTVDILDDPAPAMRFAVSRNWNRPGWPVTADFPPGGPQLLAVDADGAGDRRLEVCWAGGAEGSPDSAALFAVRADGTGMFGPPFAFVNLDRRPRPLMAALPTGERIGDVPSGPSWFAACTYFDPAADTLGGAPGGQVWMVDHAGSPLPGWPAPLPVAATTPPVIAGLYPNATVFVGCADGRVRELRLDGTVRWTSDPPLPGGVGGRLAVSWDPGTGESLVAAGGPNGDVAVFRNLNSFAGDQVWTRDVWSDGLAHTLDGSRAGEALGFVPDFLWIDFDGAGTGGAGTTPCGGAAAPELVAHHADHLWAFCAASGELLPGWGRDVGDTLVAGLGAGDPDGDGFPEVLTQSVRSAVAFWNASGHPSPGWPRVPTRDGLRTRSPALAVDVDGDGRSEIVALDGSGLIAALRADTRVPEGWPLATGALAAGAPVVADLDRDGALDIVAPDRWVPDAFRADANGRFGSLYAYTLPRQLPDPVATSWTMVGGDPGRTSALALDRTPAAGAAADGPLVDGSLRAYPNPARRRPVSFAYQLTEPAEVDFSIRDASGREVAAFTRTGRRADNLEIWEPGGVPAGLYVAQLRFRGANRSAVQQLTLGLLR